MATSEDLARLVVRLEAQTAQYDRALQQANRRADRFSKGLQRSLRTAGRAFRAFAAVVAGAGLARALTDVINTADRFQKLNDRLGITTEAISELSFAAEQTGVSTRTLELGLQRLQRRVAEAAQGAGEAQGALRELGIDAAKLADLPLDQQFELVGEALSRVSSDADRTRLAFKLFDSEGVALLQTLEGGAAGLQNFRSQAQQLGLTVSGDAAQAAADLKDRIGELRAAFEGLTRSILESGAVEALTTFAQVATEIIGGVSEYDELLRQAEAVQITINELTRLGVGADVIQAEQDKLAAIQAQIVAYNERTQAQQRSLEIEKQLASVSGADSGGQLAEISDFLIQGPRQKTQVTLLEIFDEAAEKAKKLNEVGVDLGFTFTSAFEDAIVEGENLQDVFKGLLQDIIRIATRIAITEPLGALVGGAFAGTFGGFFASGGTLGAGKWGIAGEAGPEVVMGPAKIAPISAGAGAITINQTVNATGADSEVRRALPVLLDQTRKATVIEVQKLIKQGRLA